MKARWPIFGLIALSVFGAGVVGYVYTSRSANKPTPTPQPVSQTPSGKPKQPAPEATPDNKPTTHPVNVYFSRRPESDDDPSKAFALPRASPDLGVGKFAISELLRGPTEAEKAQGYFATARLRGGDSNCSGQDFTLNIGGGTATLKFCRAFDHLGVVADGQAENEIKASLMQFSGIQKVVILNRDGDCEFNLSGMNLCK